MPESNTQTNNPPESGQEPEPEPLIVDVAVHHELPVDAHRIQEIVTRILKDHGCDFGEISVAMVDDPTIRNLNRDYLDHDYETDVLSFVLDRDESSKSLNGEIIVSADTAIALASEHGLKPVDELLLYIIHGTLHLAGFDDKEDSLRKKMREAESHYTDIFSIEYCSPDEPEVDGDIV